MFPKVNQKENCQFGGPFFKTHPRVDDVCAHGKLISGSVISLSACPSDWDAVKFADSNGSQWPKH